LRVSAEFTETPSSLTLFWARTNGIIEVDVYDKGP